MKAISYTAARETLAATMRAVCDDREPIIITRKRESPVVMMSLEDFEAMQETSYLRRSPVNAERLQDAIDQLESGRGIERELPELT
ncbi:MAG: type II toxin-antitoxin system Phd/YefM family antitoxin [Verrucomicrobiales bacterium]